MYLTNKLIFPRNINSKFVIEFQQDALKRHYSVYGKESLSTILTEKLNSADITLPKGVTANYVVTMVSDYVKDLCR